MTGYIPDPVIAVAVHRNSGQALAASMRSMISELDAGHG